jgi:predicted RNA-binding Zn-ribbon protein involved in translation (DUF1610 family)
MNKVVKEYKKEENMSAFKCPKCGKLTGGNEKFCIECGQPLNITCPECGESWRFMFEYKFCPGCGHNMKKTAANKPVRE